jgi:predicted nuclease of restriction endonuclease-like (RecB) superfamily
MSKRKLPEIAAPQAVLLNELRQLIEQARQSAAVAVNASLTMMYWHIGRRIHNEILGSERAAYGQKILSALSLTLAAEYGRGFEEKNLRRMVQFAEAFPDEAIVVSLMRQLSWTHFLALIPLKDQLQRQFYIEMCLIENWSVRVLRERIDSMLFERTALSKQPDAVIQHELKKITSESMTPALLFKDPYVLDFLGLHDRYIEKDLENAILRELEAFLLELGSGFSFVARQYRIQIDDDDFYIDLLFYNRKLKRLVAIDLKVGNFKAEYKGQMELYLRWLTRHEQEAGENPPLGIILCAGKKQEQIELLELGAAGIHVAEYLTALPPKAMLQQRLHQAITNARKKLENKED